MRSNLQGANDLMNADRIVFQASSKNGLGDCPRPVHPCLVIRSCSCNLKFDDDEPGQRGSEDVAVLGDRVLGAESEGLLLGDSPIFDMALGTFTSTTSAFRGVSLPVRTVRSACLEN